MARGCSNVNASKDGWVNARTASVPFMPQLINQTQEETAERIRMFNDNVEKRDETYYLFGEPIQYRASEMAKRTMGLREQSVNEDNRVAQDGGTNIHAVMYDLMQNVALGVGSIESIRNKYTTAGEFRLTIAQFNNLHALAKQIHKEILAIQERIDPNGKVDFYFETFAADNIKNVGGTMDMLAVFSDNTGAIYDFKTTQRNNPIGFGPSGKEVVRAPLPIGDVRAYDLAMTTYKKLAEDVLGVKKIIQARLIPIAVSYELKPHDEITPGDKYKRQYADIIGYQPKSDFLRPIPVAGERSRWEGVNKLIEKQYQHVEELEKAWKRAKTEDEKTKIKDRINKIERSIVKTLVDEDIAGLLSTMYTLTNDVETRIKEPTNLPDGSPNPNALEINEVKLLRSEMDVYHDIIKYTRSYFSDLAESDEDKFNELNSRLKEIEPEYNAVRTSLITIHEMMVLDEVADRHKDDNGNLLPYSELSAPDLTFSRISSIDNPVFQAAWRIIQEAQNEIKTKFSQLDEEVHLKTDALFKWAKENGYSRADAYKMIINEKTGNLYAKLSGKFYDLVDAAMAAKDDESIKFMKKNFEIKDPELWRKNYESRFEAYKQYVRNDLNDLKPTIIPGSTKVESTAKELKAEYERRVDWWEKQNDLMNSPDAWVFEGNRIKYLKIKQSAINENLSDEFKKFMHIKPLVDYYDMWNKRMEEFSDILGVTRYHDLPYNFIPNIRKEMLEHLNMDNLNIFGAIREFIDSFNVREEDVYIGGVSTDGQVRKIPILFMNKLRNKKTGKIDNTLKSYDLSTSLKIFGHMAYNYEHMNKIEPKILGLRTLMGDPSPEQGGMQVRDRIGRKIMGKIEPYLTKEGRYTETYKLFEDITDYYLYGIKFKDSSMVPGLDTIHILTKAKNFNAAVKLGFAVIPAMGAFGAGTLGSYFTGKKGIMYTDKHYANATKWIATDAKKYKGLSEFVDPENDSYLERSLVKDMASWKKKWMRDRTLFGFLREADKRIMRNIMVAMSQNFGIKEDGGIIRLNRRTLTDADRAKYKTIWDASKIDENTGKVTVEGLSKEGYIAFREAVKNTAGEIIGNMNPDDIGRMDTSLYINQFMAFRSWIPEIVRERLGKLRWDSKTQSMKWGRFGVLKNEFGQDLSKNEKKDYETMANYMMKILVPKMTNLIYDVALFGLAPSRMIKTQNMDRARAHYEKWLAEHPDARKDGATFEDYLEIKEAQIKAVIIEIRVIASIMALAMFLGMKGDDGEPRYYHNWFSRTMYKVFTKTGSELTFMWNPTEFERLLKNPFPVVSLISLFKNTVVNTFDETRDTIFGENSKQDKAPQWYYTSQWVPGLTQLTRFAEVFETQKKTPYQVFSMASPQ